MRLCSVGRMEYGKVLYRSCQKGNDAKAITMDVRQNDAMAMLSADKVSLFVFCRRRQYLRLRSDGFNALNSFTILLCQSALLLTIMISSLLSSFPILRV